MTRLEGFHDQSFKRKLSSLLKRVQTKNWEHLNPRILESKTIIVWKQSFFLSGCE